LQISGAESEAPVYGVKGQEEIYMTDPAVDALILDLLGQLATRGRS
jgi:hypothetical protein